MRPMIEENNEKKRTMGSHQSARMITDEWLTPKWLLDALNCEFDLDPCAPKIRPWETAKNYYTENGLKKEWFGRVWLNPPYSNQAILWLEKLVKHNNGIALVFARTETKWFWNNIWDCASGIIFLRNRLYFCDINGKRARSNAGAPSVLVSYGNECFDILKHSNIDGKFFKIE